jgi:hypothetical protein
MLTSICLGEAEKKGVVSRQLYADQYMSRRG